MRRLTTTVATFTAAILLTGIAQALTPADKCEADKLKRAGKYSFCRLKAESKAIKTASSPDYTLCDSKLSQKWANAESVGGGMCPTNGDLTSMQARITTDANDVAACLNGTCPPSCGDAIANGAESCDGVDLAGASCASLGYTLGGALACTSGCGYDVSGCDSQAFPATGQTTAYGAGSDGAVQAGATLAYTDNGDGTITDTNTGLMWEKKSDDSSIHDWDNFYTWCKDTSPNDFVCDTPGNPMDGTMVTTFLDTLNDVAGGGASCFAGHCDWRIPSNKELYSIVNLENVIPSVSPAFNTACAPTCTVLTCSCTQSYYYWSSSTYQDCPQYAWITYFYDGFVGANYEPANCDVRAVRGGS